MADNWKGRYSDAVGSIVRFSNVAARNSTIQVKYEAYGFSLSAQEWQVLEYLIEHPDNTFYMAHIASRLGIATSTLTKHSAKLVKLGLVEKYKFSDNQKNVILRASQKGTDFYNEMVKAFMSENFQAFFQYLSSFTDEQLQQMVRAMDALAGELTVDSLAERNLVKVNS